MLVLNLILPAGHAQLLFGGGALAVLRVIRFVFCRAVGALSVKIVLKLSLFLVDQISFN